MTNSGDHHRSARDLSMISYSLVPSPFLEQVNREHLRNVDGDGAIDPWNRFYGCLRSRGASHPHDPHIGFDFDSDTGAADWRALGARGMENENGCKHQSAAVPCGCNSSNSDTTIGAPLFSRSGCQVPALCALCQRAYSTVTLG
jgi:hypothetical protein